MEALCCSSCGSIFLLTNLSFSKGVTVIDDGLPRDQQRSATQAVGEVDSTRSIRAWEHAKRLVSTPLDLRQFVDIPVPSEGLDQQHSRIELAPSDIDVILFVAKS